MKLSELIREEVVRDLDGDSETEITGISYDSRATRPGDLFFSFARDSRKKRDNLNEALDRGARGVVVDGWAEDARPAVILVECEEPRRLMGTVAARLFGAPSERVNLIGVTGTSGKTTTTYLIRSIFEAAGRPCGIIGTIGIFLGVRKIYSGLTTPEAVDIENALGQMERERIGDAVAEVSSIGIDQGRVEALKFRACLFTNLGRDHLDYHGTIEQYFAAKLRLFTEILPNSSRPDPVAVVNGDDPFGRRVLAAVPKGALSFGLDRALDAYPVEATTGIGGIRATLDVLGHRIEIASPLLGEINLRNILGASTVSVALGIEVDAVAEGVRRCSGAPGRMEAVSARAGITVLVDYAHKPDALEAVLSTLRAITAGRIFCVFGCGGDRDRGKRPIMGAIAGRLSDVTIVTSDNPRNENPLGIIAQIERGLIDNGIDRIAPADARRASGYIVEPDRRAAIALGLKLAAPGDAVVVAGKGHEDYQLIGDRVLSFDDRAVIREIASEIEN